MVFWEFAVHLLALDLPWLVQLVTGNLFFLFAFACVAYFLYEKRTLFYFFVVVGLVWITGDFASVLGWQTPAVYFALFWAGRLVIRSFSGVGFVSRNMTLLMTCLFYVVLSFVNLFLFPLPGIISGSVFGLGGLATLLAVLSIHFIDIKSTDSRGLLNRGAVC